MADASSPLFRFQVWRAALPPALRTILTINVVTYVAFVVLSIVGQAGWLGFLALPGSPAALVTQPWSILTWGVTNLYGGIWGLIGFVFGMAWLNMLGSDIEETHGAAHLVGLYVFGTLVGAALALAAGAGLPGGFGAPLYFGVWGPMLALLCYVGTTSPDRPVSLFLLGEITMKWIAIGIVVLELAFTKDPSHLGAALGGFVFALAKRRGVDLGAWARPLFRDRSRRAESSRRSTGRAVGRPTPVSTPRRSGPTAPAARPGRATPKDIDAVLDKISVSGMDSLTPEELQILKNGPRG